MDERIAAHQVDGRGARGTVEEHGPGHECAPMAYGDQLTVGSVTGVGEDCPRSTQSISSPRAQPQVALADLRVRAHESEAEVVAPLVAAVIDTSVPLRRRWPPVASGRIRCGSAAHRVMRACGPGRRLIPAPSDPQRFLPVVHSASAGQGRPNPLWISSGGSDAGLRDGPPGLAVAALPAPPVIHSAFSRWSTALLPVRGGRIRCGSAAEGATRACGTGPPGLGPVAPR